MENVKLGRLLFENTVRHDNMNHSSHVYMANIYAVAGMFEESTIN